MHHGTEVVFSKAILLKGLMRTEVGPGEDCAAMKFSASMPGALAIDERKLSGKPGLFIYHTKVQIVINDMP